MLRTALAALLALASVWEGPVALPSDDQYNDTFQQSISGREVGAGPWAYVRCHRAISDPRK